MVNSELLRAVIHSNGYTQTDLADILGINQKTLRNKLKTGKFTGFEIEMMLILLDFTGFDPTEVMFSNWKEYKPLADNIIHHLST